MQRPSFALAVLFGAMASGLLVANVASCQVIVVIHDVQSEEARIAESIDELFGPAIDAPRGETGAESKVTPMATDVVADELATETRDDMPSDRPVGTDVADNAVGQDGAAGAESSEGASDDDWLADETRASDATPAATLESVVPFESAADTGVVGRELIDRDASVGATDEASAEATEAAPAAGDVTSGEPGTELGTEPVLETNSTAEGATEEDSVESSERLREAALNAAVTLDEAASWMHSMAAGLRAWAGE